MGIGPVAAIPAAVKAAGLQLDDIDLFEINEVVVQGQHFLLNPTARDKENKHFFFFQAFASQYVYCCKKLKLDPAKVNVNGGAMALGHPLGCTGIFATDKPILSVKFIFVKKLITPRH